MVVVIMAPHALVLMFVSCQAVVVLGMVVIGIRVQMPGRDLSGGRGEHQYKKGRGHPTHVSSVCAPYRAVKRGAARP
jgi:hypothetical protein